MIDLPTLDQLKETHDSLYQQTLEKRGADGKLEHDIDQLLRDINARAPFTKGLNDFLWLMNTTLQWQGVYSTILKKPKLVNIPEPADNLRGPPKLFHRDVNSMTTQIADVISLFRRGKEAERKMNEPSTRENQDADWYQAQLYICLEFLTGKLDFLREALPGSYECLENVWLQDVIQLKAYQNWQRRGAPEKSTVQQEKDDYQDACKVFQDKLENQELKDRYDRDEFGQIAEYLAKYVKKGQSSLAEPVIEKLIRQKADRYSRARIQKSHEENRKDGEGFVRKFYENIMGAIVEGEQTSIAEVSDAIWSSEGEGSRMEIMNCLEATICIYFLKGFKKDAGRWKTQVG